MTAADPTPDAFPPLADPPLAKGSWAVAGPLMYRAFKILNRWFMVPSTGRASVPGSQPPSGATCCCCGSGGRKSGVMRETPLSYLVAEGAAWVLAGFGPRTEWYRNLLVDPHVEAWLPGGRHAGIATEERDPAVRARTLPLLVKATGAPSLMIGLNPWTASDEAIITALAWVPLIRFSPDDGPLETGPDDPGGSAWIWRQALALGFSWLACKVARRAVGLFLR